VEEKVDIDELLKRALGKIKTLKAELQRASEPIAIVGMGCRFPGGADGPDKYWRLLESGTDAVTKVPADRWPEDALPAAHPATRWGGFLSDVAGFDAPFFGISPREAASLDPQHRLLLEVSWEALEDARIVPESLMGRSVGVFVGITAQDYQQHITASDPMSWDSYAATGNGLCFASGRLSYTLGLEGPCMAIDTACSSSLVAVHLACSSLRAGESELALAGGVNLLLSPYTMHLMAQTQALSPDGRCRTFDAEANGFVRAEGCGVLVLKRLSDAERDRDRIWAVVRASSVRQDGRSTGLTTPNVLAQQTLIREALESAKLTPEDVGYVEAHGTGTSLGDPIELEALLATYGSSKKDAGRCVLGSVKTNLGHLESAAGVAGLIKAVLAIDRQIIPRHLHFKTLNPRVSLEGTRLEIAKEPVRWPKSEKPRVAGVSSFGLSGTNAHVLIEEPPARLERAAPSAEPDRETNLFTLSAASPEALRAYAARIADHLTNEPAANDVAHTINTTRAALDHRLAIPFSTREELVRELRAFEERGAPGPAGNSPRIAFLFTGQGSQYAGMGRTLYEREPVFRRVLDRCEHVLRPILGRSLLEVMNASPDGLLDETAYTQPALFALEVALAELWASWGIKPSYVIGHSVGEYAAAHVAGVMDLETALRLIAERARLIQSLPRGAMSSVSAPREIVEPLLAPLAASLSIAAENTPDTVVISGTHEAIQAASKLLAERGAQTKPLTVSHAFHSPMMEPILDTFERFAEAMTFAKPKIPIVSNVNGRFALAELASARYWRDHLLAPVCFSRGISAIAERGVEALLELGPQRTLGHLAQSCFEPGKAPPILSSLKRASDDGRTILEALGRLFVLGARPNLAALDAPFFRRKVELPTYPFQHRRHWTKRVAWDRSWTQDRAGEDDGHPLLGRRLETAGSEIIFEAEWGLDSVPVFFEHNVFGRAVVPIAAFMELGRAAAEAVLETSEVAVESISVIAPVVLERSAAKRVQIVLEPERDGSFRLSVHTRRESGFGRDATMIVRRGAEREIETVGEIEEARFPTEVSPEAWYHAIEERGVTYGPSFRSCETIRRGEREALVGLRSPPRGEFGVHPAIIDAAVQSIAAAVSEVGGARVLLPIGVERFVVFSSPKAPARAYAQLHPSSNGSSSFTGDVSLLDAEHRVIARLEGVRLRETEDATFSGKVAPLRTEWLHDLEWRPTERVKGDAAIARWIVIGGGPIGDRIAGELGAARDLAALTAETFGVVHLGAFEPSDDPLEHGTGGVARLAREIAREKSVRRLVIVTSRAVKAGPKDRVIPFHAATWGLGRVLQTEHPELGTTLIDVDVAAIDQLADEIRSSSDEDQIALRGTSRYCARLVRRRSSGVEVVAFSAKADAAYLVTGGTRGLGLEAARWLVAKGAQHLYLVGRRAPDEDAQRTITALGVRVEVIAKDLSKRSEVESLLELIEKSGQPLKGVIHCAGQIGDALLVDRDWAEQREVLEGKIFGAWHLHQLTKELDFFVSFSSIASILGSRGQSAYAAANAFLDGLAEHRRSLGLLGTSIIWGLWDLGMKARLSDQVQRYLRDNGMKTIRPEEGLALLEHLLETGAVRPIVLPIDWETVKKRLAALGRSPPLLREFVGTRTRGSKLRDEITSAPSERRAELLRAAIHEEVARVLGAESVPSDKPLMDLGFDSLMAVELRDSVAAMTALELSVTVVFDHPTIDALTTFLLPRIVPEQIEKKKKLGRRSSNEGAIAIVGIGCRFPGGGEGPERFWRLLDRGTDVIGEVPPERWSLERYHDPDPDAVGKTYTRWGGFLSGIDQFDTELFGIAPREALAMDPQQRLLLEVSFEALEHAGLSMKSVQATPTGTFVGIMGNDYLQRLKSVSGELRSQIDPYIATGNAFSVAAGRISYVFGLKGPTLVTDTACSSSLVAIHLASRALKSGECDLALAGGVNLQLSPEPTILSSRLRALSPTGRCKTFDASADGYVRGDGCGVVVLKRLEDAKAQGDRILAVILSSAVNHDGRSNGLTAPNGPSQEALIRTALEEAGVAPHEVAYVETHGTGTPLGDPIEVRALANVLGEGRPSDRPLIIGSVKTNIGHTEGAAGVAGVIKAVLSLNHDRIPPHLHFEKPNPYIPWSELPVQVAPRTGSPWPKWARRRIAGVSSFGISGTNAHLVLEAPEANVERTPPRTVQLLPISAHSKAALEECVRRYGSHLSATESSRDALCASSGARAAFVHRVAVVGANLEELSTALESARPAEAPGASPRVGLYMPKGITAEGKLLQSWGLVPAATAEFEEEMRRAPEVDLWLEISPRPSGVGAIHVTEGDERSLLRAVAELYMKGVDFDWRRFFGPIPRVELPPYPFQRSRYWIEDADEKAAPSSPAAVKEKTSGAVVEAIRKAHPNRRSILIADYVQREVSRALGKPAGELVGLDQGFFELGMDSLMAVELMKRMEAEIGRELPATVAFEHPNIESLSRYVEGLLFERPAKVELLSEERSAEEEPIAIIGMACRFPGGANSIRQYWDLLHEGVDGISEVPKDRWDIDEYYDPDPDAPGKMNVRKGGFLSGVGVDRFDAHFFGISPREAVSMDPQHRLLLEIAWEAFEDAGLPPLDLAGTKTGVFVGVTGGDYAARALLFRDWNVLDPYAGTGNSFSIAAGRVAFAFGLQGPTMAVDATCASSLVSLHLAAQALRSREAETAIAGGVNLLLEPHPTIYFSKLRGLSPDGACKTFDRSANGYVRGEGCAMLVLKRLSDAVRAKDRIHGVLLGSAVNHGGRASALTVPNGAAQQGVIEAALASARVEPRAIDYIEAHGTGTALGDPIEAAGLVKVFGQERKDRPLVLASCKTNIGHLEAAAGVAGVIKVLLMMRHEEIPPHLHFRELNPSISWGELAVSIPTAALPWPKSDRRRVAGVSSFGISGTNAHAVIAEGPPYEVPSSEEQDRTQVLALSARRPEALADLARSYRELLSRPDAPTIADVAFTASVKRSHLDHRLAVTGKASRELVQGLTSFLEKREHPQVFSGAASPGRRPGVVFVYSGHGSQWMGMARDLRDDRAFKSAFEACRAALSPHLDAPIEEVLENAAHLSRVDLVQPAIFAIQVAVTAYWHNLGVVPDLVIGHSMGEVAAAHVSGALALEDAARVITMRSRLMRRVQGKGAMLLVGLSASASKELIRGREGLVAIAAVNGPKSTALSGDPAALTEIEVSLRSQNTFCRRVQTDVAFHGPQLEPLRWELIDALDGISSREASIPVWSTVTASELAGPELGPDYWGRNLVEPVLFADAIQKIIDQGHDTFLELSPHPVLTASIEESLRAKRVAGSVIGSLEREKPSEDSLLRALSALYVRGFAISWTALHPSGGRLVDLPHYPWQRSRYWLEGVGTRVLEGRAPPEPKKVETPKDRPLAGNYRITWEERPIRGEPRRERRTWILLADRGGFAERLKVRLAEEGDHALVVRAEDRLRAILNEEDRRSRNGLHVVSLLSLDVEDTADPKKIEEHQGLILGSALETVKSFAKLGPSRGRITVITRGAQATGTESRVSALQAPIWGFGRSAILEHPEIWRGLVDLDPDREDLAALVAELRSADGEDQVALRGGKRFVARLVESEEEPARELRLRSDSTYWITGGLGGLGLQLAAWLVDRGARHILLSGRSGPKDDRTKAAISALEAKGVQISVGRADVSNVEETERLIGTIDPPLRGIIHAAGVLEFVPIEQLDLSRLLFTIRAKVVGGRVLDRLTASRDLDFFVGFSSIAGVCGSGGLAAYSAGNHFLDVLADQRKREGKPGLAVSWGRWEGEGMGKGSDESLRYLEKIGMAGLDPDLALRSLGALIERSATHSVIASVDWERYRPILEAKRRLGLLEHLGGRSSTLDGRSELVDRLKAADQESRWQILIDLVRDSVKEVMQLDGDIAFGLNEGFFQMGMDSITSVELRRRLQSAIARPLPATVAFEFPTVESLARHLASETLADLELFSAKAEAVPEAVEKSAPSPSEDVSEEELEAMFEEQLRALKAKLAT
jgi:acyl transferase domain-containing protein